MGRRAPRTLHREGVADVVEPEPDPEPEQPKATGSGGMLLLALAVVLAIDSANQR